MKKKGRHEWTPLGNCFADSLNLASPPSRDCLKRAQMITSSHSWDDEDGNAPTFLSNDRPKERFVNSPWDDGLVCLPTNDSRHASPASRLRSAHGTGSRPHISGGAGREGRVCCTPGLIRFSAGTLNRDSRSQSRCGCSRRCNAPRSRCHMSTDVDGFFFFFFCFLLGRYFLRWLVMEACSVPSIRNPQSP